MAAASTTQVGTAGGRPGNWTGGRTRSRLRQAASVGAVVALAGAVAVTGAGPASAGATRFRQTNLISDLAGRATTQDTSVVNPWGIAALPDKPLWVANNGSGNATIYLGAVGGSPVTKAPLTVPVAGGAPTGQVANTTTAFVVGDAMAGTAAPALFLFDSLTGDVTGWNPALTEAVVVRHVPGAVFTGLSIGTVGGAPVLYAADFGHSKVWLLDSMFRPVNRPGAFMDRTLPAGYAPFNVAAMGGRVYVSYAKRAASGEEVKGTGKGFVDVYTASGGWVKRLVSRTGVNAPWAMTMAPSSFGTFGGDLLVGNFGSGRISAYDPMTGDFHGFLRRPGGEPVGIGGLWGLMPGNAAFGGAGSLVFAAGIGDETHGLVGVLAPAS